MVRGFQSDVDNAMRACGNSGEADGDELLTHINIIVETGKP